MCKELKFSLICVNLKFSVDRHEGHRFMLCVKCFATGHNVLEVCLVKDFLTGLTPWLTDTTPNKTDYKKLYRQHHKIETKEEGFLNWRPINFDSMNGWTWFLQLLCQYEEHANFRSLGEICDENTCYVNAYLPHFEERKTVNLNVTNLWKVGKCSNHHLDEKHGLQVCSQ